MTLILTYVVLPKKRWNNWASGRSASSMALTIPCPTTRIIGLDEYLAHMDAEVNLRDVDSIAASAQMLRALANDRALVVRELNRCIEGYLVDGTLASTQSLFLGRGKGFYVRASIWPAIADMASGRAYQDQVSYNLAHDHNFTFLTVNYLGSGYETEIYEYDNEKVEGYVGERVDLRFLEKVRFGAGTVMLYRQSRDVHVQYAPTELTITLNLMIDDRNARIRDQYFFDLASQTIAGYPHELPTSARSSLLTIAGYVGDDDTSQMLHDLAKQHPCRRTRLTAFQSLSRQRPDDAASIWETASADTAPLVANTARKHLQKLERA